MQFTQASKFILRKLKKELPKHLSYHSVDHVKDVYNSCREIGREEKISPYEMKLLLTAALYHDSGFLRGANAHEEESCRIAQESLLNFGYTAEEIERICGLIMATKIPQLPKNHLEEILADADLDYLGRDDFFAIGDKLFKELSVFGILSTETEWNRVQVKFLEGHHYFTQTTVKLRQEKKMEHLAQVKKKLE
ncbi:HD domain-containing protein [Mucilaginibacter sp. BJC16-A38]|uniref:HD domain-containing protein n=1 Tax=Mucilaginibacter phenanthrenivorans TaxID=1234842 RepID=UPI00215814A2|nr:HD domain-containing protein [Mucilaginibacter phenanthrenivorans]MCR8560101.1 HD domain-containing protein [Mucilaginibacter phenanthrenivorans]